MVPDPVSRAAAAGSREPGRAAAARARPPQRVLSCHWPVSVAASATAIAKATLYSAFGSKEELVRTYLEARHASRRAAVLAEMALHDDPRRKLLALFDVLVTTVTQPQFRGCAFANASAESGPDSAAADVTRTARAWLLAVMTEQATALGVADPAGLARQLTLLYDGALAQSRLDRGLAAATAAKAAAQALIDAASPAAGSRRKPPEAAGRDRPARRPAPATSRAGT
jgi:AcrR family transcriptional regulator